MNELSALLQSVTENIRFIRDRIENLELKSGSSSLEDKIKLSENDKVYLREQKLSYLRILEKLIDCQTDVGKHIMKETYKPLSESLSTISSESIVTDVKDVQDYDCAEKTNLSGESRRVGQVPMSDNLPAKARNKAKTKKDSLKQSVKVLDDMKNETQSEKIAMEKAEDKSKRSNHLIIESSSRIGKSIILKKKKNSGNLRKKSNSRINHPDIVEPVENKGNQMLLESNDGSAGDLSIMERKTNKGSAQDKPLSSNKRVIVLSKTFARKGDKDSLASKVQNDENETASFAKEALNKDDPPCSSSRDDGKETEGDWKEAVKSYYNKIGVDKLSEEFFDHLQFNLVPFDSSLPEKISKNDTIIVGNTMEKFLEFFSHYESNSSKEKSMSQAMHISTTVFNQDCLIRAELILASYISQQNIPTLKHYKERKFGDWLAKTIIRKVSLLLIVSADENFDLRDIMKAIRNRGGYIFPCLWSLQSKGRLLFTRRSN